MRAWRTGVAGAALVGLSLLAACSGPSAQSGAGLFGLAGGAADVRPAATAPDGGARFRTERAPADALFGPADLERAFMAAAFTPEPGAAPLEALRAGELRLSRWVGPIRFRVDGDRATRADRTAARRVAAELARVTGLSISEAQSAQSANLSILVNSALVRRRVADSLSSRVWYGASAAPAYLTADAAPCIAVIDTETPLGGAIRGATILIQAELRGPAREACLEEEFAQSLGLFHDSPAARPSIFNDDQEFARLTDHDAQLLRLLYAPALRPGLSAAQTRPIVRSRLGL